jgi:hypothetical protein
MIHGRLNFPFALELFCLFFERFPETRQTFVHHSARPRTHVRMCMWGEMMPKRAQPEFPTRIALDALRLLGSAVDQMFIMVLCPYAGLD